MANPERKSIEKDIKTRYDNNDIFVRDENVESLGNVNKEPKQVSKQSIVENLYDKKDLYNRNDISTKIDNRYKEIKNITKKVDKIENVNNKKR